MSRYIRLLVTTFHFFMRRISKDRIPIFFIILFHSLPVKLKTKQNNKKKKKKKKKNENPEDMSLNNCLFPSRDVCVLVSFSFSILLRNETQRSTFVCNKLKTKTPKYIRVSSCEERSDKQRYSQPYSSLSLELLKAFFFLRSRKQASA